MEIETVVLSPHLDDAAFSVGACLLSGLFPRASVINIYSRSGYRIDSLGEESEVTHRRMQEDREAMRLLGIAASYWGFPDTSLKPEYPDEPSYLNPAADPKSDKSYSAVSERIADVVRTRRAALFLSPLGLGYHIEHRIVAEVCHGFLQEGMFVAFYEDGSYFEKSVTEATTIAEHLGLTSHITISPLGFSWKEGLVKVYSSQIDEQTLASLRRSYSETGGERLWSTDRVIDQILHMVSTWHQRRVRSEDNPNPFWTGTLTDVIRASVGSTPSEV